MQLSPNFTLEELLRSQTALRMGLANDPGSDEVQNLQQLCLTLLEPARTILGVPLHVDSGFRSAILNAAVGGAYNSAHVEGRAADIIPIGMSLSDAFEVLRRNTSLNYDQLIFECRSWLHLAIAPAATKPRREVLTAAGTPGHWTYQVVPSWES